MIIWNYGLLTLEIYQRKELLSGSLEAKISVWTVLLNNYVTLRKSCLLSEPQFPTP